MQGGGEMNCRPSRGPGTKRPGPLAGDDVRNSWGPSWGLGRVLASSLLTSPPPPPPELAPALLGLQPGIQAWPLPPLPRSARLSSARLGSARLSSAQLATAETAPRVLSEAAQKAPPEEPRLSLCSPILLCQLHPSLPRRPGPTLSLSKPT